MYTNIHPLHLPPCKGMLFILMLFAKMLFGQNNALHFDGANDYITLNPIKGFAANSDFTVEMWFLSTATGGNGTCVGDFRHLFSFGPTGPLALNSFFSVGECGGLLSIETFNGAPGPGQSGLWQMSTGIRGAWHCISVVRSGDNVTTYLDANLIPALQFNIPLGGIKLHLFRVGHLKGQSPQVTPGQDWEGYIDEVKLWNIALSSTQLTTCNACVLTGNEPNLVAYWRLDEGIAEGDNSGISTVLDASYNANNSGALSVQTLTPPGFALTPGPTSNFVTSTAPIVYPQYSNHGIFLSDPLQTVSLGAICSGDPVHFSITDANGAATQAGPGTSVTWEYSDDCLNWTPVPIIPDSPPSAVFNGLTFVSPPGHPATSVANCSSNPNGFVERCYRAIITVTNGLGTCTYTTQSQIQIFCPISATMTLNPAGPLCDGDTVKFTASLTTNLPAPISSNYVHINWCVIINGVTTPLTGPLYDDQMTINYLPNSNIIVNPNQICFKAVVSNFACTPVTVQQCVTVDSMPVCGTITGSASPNTLYPDPDGNPDHYVICPFDDAAVEIKTPFTSCIPLWQYMFPSGGTWKDLGSSNGVQNTNVLPHLKPSASPYLWPVGETCIMYRIKCLPLNNPSGCQPCYSNELRVCLKSVPTIPIIVANPNPICKGSFSTLSVQNPSNNIDYNWYCNGLFMGNDSSLNASKKACYWVTATDIPACQTSTSDKICLEVCEAVAIIGCPTPICPCLGYPITLNAMNSYSNCGPLKYFWSWSDSDGAQTSSDPNITSTPNDSGSIYTLIVTDANGCTDTTSMTVVPCAN